METTNHKSIIDTYTQKWKEWNKEEESKSRKEDPYTRCQKRLTSNLMHTQTESKETGKVIPCKWKQKEIWGSNTYIRKNWL